MKVWITKYALTKGIMEKDVEQSFSDGMVVDRKSGFAQFFHGEGKEWHKNPTTAAVKAEEMRINKIARLKKQINNLEKLEF